MVFFTITKFADVPLDQRLLLPTYPNDAAIKAFHNMLAPPRGYNGRARQRSIWEAFGYNAKVQVLQITAVGIFGKFPKDVLVRMLKFVGPLAKTLTRHLTELLKLSA